MAACENYLQCRHYCENFLCSVRAVMPGVAQSRITTFGLIDFIDSIAPEALLTTATKCPSSSKIFQLSSLGLWGQRLLSKFPGPLAGRAIQPSKVANLLHSEATGHYSHAKNDRVARQ